MEELLKELVQEQKKTNEFLINKESKPVEKLTVQDIVEQYGIAENKVYQMFKDPELAVQDYVRPKFVLKDEFEKYLSVRHDYLSNK